MKQAFLFSGQGAQYPGMGRDYVQSYDVSRTIFSLADQVLGRPISKLCLEGSEEELRLTHNTQPCTFTVDFAIFQAARQEGYAAEGYAGFSLGEYVALAASGVLSFEDALRLVQFRADAMQGAVPEGTGAMAAIKECPEELLGEACHKAGGIVQPANYNSPRQTVLSGEAAAVARALEYLKGNHVRGVLLPVSAPFHTPLLEPARKALEEAFAKLVWHDAVMPVYLNADAKPHTDKEEIRKLVLQQTTSPVLWMQTIRAMRRDGFDAFYEMGPGHTLSGFNKTIFRDDPGVCFRTFGTVEAMRA